MYFRVVKECRFDGVAYRVGAVIDRADPAICARLLSELRPYVVLTNDPRPMEVEMVVEAAPEQVVSAAPVKAVKAKRSHK